LSFECPEKRDGWSGLSFECPVSSWPYLRNFDVVLSARILPPV
jgi:hypothetical protein